DGLNWYGRRPRSERSGAGPPLSYGFASGHQVRDRRPADVDAIAERMRSVHRLRARDDVARRVVDGHDAVDRPSAEDRLPVRVLEHRAVRDLEPDRHSRRVLSEGGRTVPVVAADAHVHTPAPA